MMPVSFCIAIAANQSGIGGAAVFGPIFIILFPLFGPQYPLHSPAAAVSTAIFVEIFGFSSGILGYGRRGLIDIRLAAKFAVASVPMAIISSLFLHIPPIGLKILYTIIMLTLSVYMFRLSNEKTTTAVGPLAHDTERAEHEFPPDSIPPPAPDGMVNPLISSDQHMAIPPLELTTQPSLTPTAGVTRYPYALYGHKAPTYKTLKERINGKVHTYLDLPVDAFSLLLASCGGLMVGLIGVGLGEVTIPRLMFFKVPVEVASAASVFSLTLTCMAAASIQFATLIRSGGINAVPWSLIMWMIPGVVLGAQVGTYFQGVLPKKTMQRAIGCFFGFVGLLFLVVVIKTQQEAEGKR